MFLDLDNSATICFSGPIQSSRRSTPTSRPSIAIHSSILVHVSSSVIPRGALVPSSSKTIVSHIAPIRRDVRVYVGADGPGTRIAAPSRHAISSKICVISVRGSVVLRWRRTSVRSAISLPCRPSVVPIPTAVDAPGAPISVSRVEAGGGAVGVGTDSYCAAFGCWG